MEKTVKVLNSEGLHARPAGIFAKTAAQFQSAVEIHFNGRTINGKSIMSLMGTGIEKDSEIKIVTKGSDEAVALESLVTLVNSGFGESAA